MALQLKCLVEPLTKQSRAFSTAFKFFDVTQNDKNGISTVTMKRAPVNSISLEFLQEFLVVLNGLENNKVNGMILASSFDNVFSAGLDLNEMFKPNPERFTKFWKSLQDIWEPLYNSTFPTAALITGHAPAGGCLLSICCDYRVMLNNFTIGLNETRVGLPIPYWVGLTMEHTIGYRNADLALTTGKMFTTEEALKIGLIDENASSRADALVKALEFFKKFDDVLPSARITTKQIRRLEDLQVVSKNREKELDFLLNYVMKPEFQKHVEEYLRKLKTRKRE